MTQKRIAFKLDIDTYRGMKEGLPRLLDLFRDEGVRASIFVSFGPDESGKAVKRVFTKKGFLKKMFRTNAAKLYGFRTMLYGTLLPAPAIGTAFPELVLRANSEGHDVGIHAFSHVRWQDDLDSMTPAEIHGELEAAWQAYVRIAGSNAPGFAAPAWKINADAFSELNKYPWQYFSICRGPAPVYPVLGGVAPAVPELPTTLPTLDEILAWDGMDAGRALSWLLERAGQADFSVYTLHTEAEGLAYFRFFSDFLRGLKSAGFAFQTLASAAKELNPGNTPRCEIRQGELPGRAGLVGVVGTSAR